MGRSIPVVRGARVTIGGQDDILGVTLDFSPLKHTEAGRQAELVAGIGRTVLTRRRDRRGRGAPRAHGRGEPGEGELRRFAHNVCMSATVPGSSRNASLAVAEQTQYLTERESC
jgi:hypothetical protein